VTAASGRSGTCLAMIRSPHLSHPAPIATRAFWTGQADRLTLWIRLHRARRSALRFGHIVYDSYHGCAM
jgi:hypothetical protein